MKAQRPYPQITITPKGEAALVGGHPWVYEGEVTGLSGPVSDGQLVDVISRRGSWLGCGFFNSRSRIRVRVLSRNPNDRFDRAFWRRRIQYAWDYRKTVMGPEDSRCCRMIFGEADGFPGLTVDRFESVLVAQVLCLGMELIKEELFSLLLEVLRSDGQDVVGVYERNDVVIRELEGMEQGKGWHPVDGEKAPDFTAVDIEENGIRYTVDFENGQKTGFFLDQKYNRQAVAKLARGRTVLDCFTHTGSFALNAARGGAKHVTAVDVSEFAVACARENARRNGLSDVMECVAANVFDLLPQLEQQPKRYDFIILDPPAFTKSRKTTQRAMTGYKEINYRAMRLLPRGGYLATCSCSHFATEELF
jgi:23S rRNA (cytosine1962-C5)-methyltransferase